jgi:hypothetical protein
MTPNLILANLHSDLKRLLLFQFGDYVTKFDGRFLQGYPSCGRERSSRRQNV